MQIQINFLNDFRKLLCAHALRIGYASDENLPIEKLIYDWLDYQNRLIWPAPRKVLVSKEFSLNQIPFQVQEIIEKSENGADLNGYLSRNAHSLDAPDMLLIDWDIKHFHLDDDFQNAEIKTRSRELIFFVQRPDTLYFIQISNHKNFSNDEMLEIINRNWPDLTQKLNGILPGEKIDSKGIHKLRKAGIQTSPSLSDGTVVFGAGGGYTTAGTSIKLQMQSDWIIRSIVHFEDLCRKEISKQGLLAGKLPKISRGHLTFTEEGNMYYEPRQGVLVKIKGPNFFKAE